MDWIAAVRIEQAGLDYSSPSSPESSPGRTNLNSKSNITQIYKTARIITPWLNDEL
jgi:hypothetical protein